MTTDAAAGFFEVAEDVSQFTNAAVFQPRTRTEALIRFSSLAAAPGSPGTWRDPREAAIRFYTTEGDYDLAGYNAPVFCVRDPIKSPDYIRSRKRGADNHLRDNDTQWDFWSLNPESAHQVTWLMGDRGLPRTWRHMNLYGSRTFQWVNAGDERFWIKYHFRTDQGHDFLTQSEADRIASEDADYHDRDLRTAIDSGEHPSWTLYVQVMPYEDAPDYRFNPFDATKVWPHGDHSLVKVGRLVLNRNPDEHSAQIEEAAFDPSNFVPGIGGSPEGMLQSRPATPGITGLDQEILRSAYRPHTDDDDFGQPGTLVRRVFGDEERDRLVGNVVAHLSDGVSKPVLERSLGYWRNVDKSIGDRIADKIGG